MHAPRSSHYTHFCQSPLPFYLPPPPPPPLPPRPRSDITTTIPNSTLHHQPPHPQNEPPKINSDRPPPPLPSLPPHHLTISTLTSANAKSVIAFPSAPLHLLQSFRARERDPDYLPHTHFQHGVRKPFYFGVRGNEKCEGFRGGILESERVGARRV